MPYSETVQGGVSALTTPFIEMFTQVASFLPVIFAGFGVLLLGLIVSPLVGSFVTKALQMIKIDQGLDQIGAKDAMSSIGLHFTFSKLAGTFVKYVVLIVFINMVAEILQLGQLSRLIDDVVRFIPQIVIALVIIGVGLTVADWLRDIVTNVAKASDNADYSSILGSITRISVIVFATMAALTQLGIAPALIQIVFAGVVLAFALAFGLGSKDIVARTLESWIEKK